MACLVILVHCRSLRKLTVRNMASVQGDSSKEALVSRLRHGGIDTTRYGVGATKSIDSLWKEVQLGESELRSGEEGIERVVRVVRVKVVAEIQGTNHVLVEQWQTLANGNTRRREMLLAGKCMAGEDPRDAAEREVAEELGPDFPMMALRWNEDVLNTLDRKISESYPGLASVYETTLFTASMEVDLVASSGDFGLGKSRRFETVETDTNGVPRVVHHWEWVNERAWDAASTK